MPFLAQAVAHVDSGGSVVLPTNTFEWLLDHGVPGLLLAAVFFLGVMLYRVLGEKARLEVEFREKILSNEREFREKALALKDDQIKIKDAQISRAEASMERFAAVGEKTARILALNTEALKKFDIVVDEGPGSAGGSNG